MSNFYDLSKPKQNKDFYDLSLEDDNKPQQKPFAEMMPGWTDEGNDFSNAKSTLSSIGSYITDVFSKSEGNKDKVEPYGVSKPETKTNQYTSKGIEQSGSSITEGIKQSTSDILDADIYKDTFSSAKDNLITGVKGSKGFYDVLTTEFLKDFTGANIENIYKGAGLDEKPQAQTEVGQKSAEFLGSLGANLGHLAMSQGIISGTALNALKVAPQLKTAYDAVPTLIQGGLRLGSTWTGKKMLQTEIHGGEHSPKDITETFLTGFLAAPVGQATGGLLKELAIEGYIPDSIYPLVQGVGSGGAKGAAMTGVQKLFDDEGEVGIDDLAMNMATMAIWNTIPAITNYKEMQNNVQQIRNFRQAGQQAVKDLNIIRPKDIETTQMAKEDLRAIEAGIMKSTASNQFRNLSSGEKSVVYNQLNNIMKSAELADSYIANMSLSNKAKIIANSSLKDIISNSISDLFSTTMGQNITINIDDIKTSYDKGTQKQSSETFLLPGGTKIVEGKSFSQRPALQAGAELIDAVTEVPLLESGVDVGSVDIQNAKPADLLGIKGVGASLSQRIAEYAKSNPIDKPEDLLNISGIGKKTIENMDTSKFNFSTEFEAPESIETDVEEPVEDDIELIEMEARESILEDIEEWEVLESDTQELHDLIQDERDIDAPLETIEKIKSEFIENKMSNIPDDNELTRDLYTGGVQFTDDIRQSLWLFPNGTMIDGEFDMGSRGLDHRIINSQSLEHNPEDGNIFWNELHDKYNVVRLTPESMQGLIKENQPLTDVQKQLMEEVGYEVEPYLEDTSPQEIEEPTVEEPTVEDTPETNLTADEIENEIDDLFFELDYAETETEQYELRQEIDRLKQQRSEMIDNQEGQVDTQQETEMVETKPYEEREVIKSIEQAEEENVSVIPDRKHLCQQCAYDNLMQNDVGYLVLGNVEGIGFDGNIKRVRHAWVEYKDSIYDPQFDRYFSKEFYGEQFKPRGERAFSKQEAKDEITVNRTTTEEVQSEIDNQTSTETKTADIINLNSATIDDLTEIKGIGASTAQNIINYRDSKENGIESVDDLKQVKGIGSATFDKIAPSFTAEQVDSTDTTDTIEEPTDSDITVDDDVESEVENLDADEIASEVDETEGTLDTTNELMSDEARELLEFEGEDIRDTLDIVYYTSLEELENSPQTERDDLLNEIRTEQPDVADAIEAELEERGYQSDDFSYRNKVGIKDKVSSVFSKKSDGVDEGVNKATRANIENIIRTDLDIPLRYGKLQSRDAAAQFDQVYNTIRTRDYSNMEVTAHEVGHFLSKKLDLNVKSFPELVDVLEGEGLKDAYDPSDHHEEGNSEFFKMYFNNPGEAKLKAPNYFDYVEGVIKDSNLYEPIKKLQSEMTTWNNQSAADRLSGAMSREGLKINKILGVKDKITRELVDSDIVFKRALEKAGIDLDDLEVMNNPWKLKRLYDSVNDIVNVNLTKFSIDPQGRKVGKSLLEILKPVEDFIGAKGERQFGDFEVYSLAAHSLEREAKFLSRELSEIKNDRAKVMSKKLDEAIVDGDFDVLVNILKDVKNYPMLLQNAGMGLEYGEYDFRATGIDVDDIANVIKEYDNKQFKTTLKELQSYQENLIDYAVYYNMLSEDAAENIKNAYSFHIPLQRYFGEELVNQNQVSAKYTDLPEPVKKAYGSTRIIQDPLRSIVRETSYIIRQSNKNNIAVKFMEALDKHKDEGIGNLVGRPIDVDEPINNENVINYKVDGQNVARIAHPDIYEVLQGMDKDSLEATNFLMKGLKTSNQLFKQFAVINPKFWLNNLGRDEVRELVYNKNGMDKLKLFSSMVDGMMSAFNMDSSEVDGVFRALGGARGGFASYLKEMDSPETLNELLEADKVSKNPLRWLGDVAQWTEDTRRKGIFVDRVGKEVDINSLPAKEAERVLKDAAYHAKGGVLEDYSIRGNTTEWLDTFTNPFSTAGVTGGRHLYDKLKEPATWLKGIAFITIPALYLWNKNKDKPEYQELPAWKKMLFFNYIKEDGEIMSFPKPFITGYFFGAIPEMIRNYQYNKSGGELKDNFSTIINAGLPNYKMAGAIPATYEAITNTARPLGDSYDIIPESEKYLEPKDQYGDYTSEFAKLVGKSNMISPRIVDHIMKGQFTGTYNMLTEITNWIAGSQDFRESSLGIVGVYSDPYITSTTVNKLYEDRAKYNNYMSRLRDKALIEGEDNLNLEEAEQKAMKYSQINRITDTMAKYRQLSEIVDTLDINEELKKQTKMYISVENINMARQYYGKELIELDSYMNQEEYQQIQNLLNWIQNNY